MREVFQTHTIRKHAQGKQAARGVASAAVPANTERVQRDETENGMESGPGANASGIDRGEFAEGTSNSSGPEITAGSQNYGAGRDSFIYRRPGQRERAMERPAGYRRR